MDELQKALAALADLQKKFDSVQAELEKARGDTKRRDDSAMVELQKQLDTARAEVDTAKAEVKRLQDAKKTDDGFARKMAIVDGARVLHGKHDAVDTSKSEREIMIAALKSRDSSFREVRADGTNESDDYIRCRFDLAVEAQKKADSSNANAMRGTAMGGTANADGSPNVEFVTDEAARAVRQYDAAFYGNQAFTMNRWKGESEANEARKSITKDVMDGKALGHEFVAPIFDGREVMERTIAAMREHMPRATLDRFARVEGLRRDADPATAFFQRQLLYVITKPYFVVYPEIKYASLFPVSYEVPNGARTWGAHQFDELGQGDIVDDYADDAPDAEIVGKELIGRFFPVRSQFQYSFQDIRSAMMAGLPLDAMKAGVARRIIERKCDALAALGDTARSFKGLANDTNATTSTATTKAAGGTKWITLSTGVISATPDEMLNDINVLYSAIFNGTGGNIEPDTLIVSKSIWGVLQTKRLDSFNQVTVGGYLRDKLSWLKRLEYWPRLNTAGSGGIERTMMAALNPDYAQLMISQEFEVFPPQPRNMSWVNPCHKRWGEPKVLQPKTLAYMDNLVA